MEPHSQTDDTPQSRAILEGQEALQKHEDMTFSDAEIDAFLPRELKRSSRAQEIINREAEKILRANRDSGPKP